MAEKEPLVEWRNTHLDSVSKSFCAAKWLNASLHLGHGFTNSCHLPLPHPIDLEEIKTNNPDINIVTDPKYEKEKVISSNRVTRKFWFIFHKLSMLLEQGNDYSGTDRDLGNL